MKHDHVVGLIIASVITLAVAYGSVKAWAKYHVCKAYYAELPLLACFESDHGLPPRKGTKP